MSFLARFKKGGSAQTAHGGAEPLAIDAYQTSTHLVLFAQVGGARLSDIHISLEGEGSILIIEGTRTRPDIPLPSSGTHHRGRFLVEECGWDAFYRRIILPHRIHLEEAEAAVEDGVLSLVLPFERSSRRYT